MRAAAGGGGKATTADLQAGRCVGTAGVAHGLSGPGRAPGVPGRWLGLSSEGERSTLKRGVSC